MASSQNLGSEVSSSTNNQQFKSVFAKAREMTKNIQAVGNSNTTSKSEFSNEARNLDMPQPAIIADRKRDSDLLQE